MKIRVLIKSRIDRKHDGWMKTEVRNGEENRG